MFVLKGVKMRLEYNCGYFFFMGVVGYKFMWIKGIEFMKRFRVVSK